MTSNNTTPNTQRDSVSVFLEWFAIQGVDRFDIGVGRWNPDGTKGQFLAPMHTQAGDLPADEVMRRIGWLAHENINNSGDAYIRPARSHDWPIAFLDDVPTAKARRLAEQRQSLVIETSPGRCHVWIQLSHPCSEAERAAVQKVLAARFGADPGSTSGDHFGRLPGFRNRKPKRFGCWVNLLDASETEAPALVVPTSNIQPTPQSHLPTVGRGLHTPRPDSAEAGGYLREFGYVVGRLRWAAENGLDLAAEKEALISKLADQALERGKRSTPAQARRYAEKTVSHAAQSI